MERLRSRLGCFWIGVGVLALCSCASAGIGRLADGGVAHAADYSSPLFSFGLLGCFCLVLPALAVGVGLGILHGRRSPPLTQEELDQIG
jgi:hypothetical protein